VLSNYTLYWGQEDYIPLRGLGQRLKLIYAFAVYVLRGLGQHPKLIYAFAVCAFRSLPRIENAHRG
jgi:hypothetical protein